MVPPFRTVIARTMRQGLSGDFGRLGVGRILLHGLDAREAARRAGVTLAGEDDLAVAGFEAEAELAALVGVHLELRAGRAALQ